MIGEEELKKENSPINTKGSRASKLVHCNGDSEKRIDMLKHTKQDFKVSRTSQSVKVVDSLGYGYMYSSSGSVMSFKEINEQRLLKKHMHEQISLNGINLNHDLNPTNVRYFDVSDDLFIHGAKSFDNCVSFDINMAYYRTAYTLGFITKEYYEKCEKLPKMTRLRLIGSIATKKRIYVYKGGKLSDIEVKQDRDLRAAWFAIVKRVGDCMEEFKQLANLNGRNRFIMYWVDGIYLRGNASDYSEILLEIERKYNLTFKTELINKIEYHFDSMYKYGKLHVFKKGIEDRVDRKTGEIKDFKSFSLQKRNDIYEMINY